MTRGSNTITAWAINEDGEVISPVATLNLRPVDKTVTLAVLRTGSGFKDYLNPANRQRCHIGHVDCHRVHRAQVAARAEGAGPGWVAGDDGWKVVRLLVVVGHPPWEAWIQSKA